MMIELLTDPIKVILTENNTSKPIILNKLIKIIKIKKYY